MGLIIGGGGSAIGSLKFEVVASLPPISQAKKNVVYLVPTSTTADDNIYDQYAIVDGDWGNIGVVKVDLTNLAEIETKLLYKYEKPTDGIPKSDLVDSVQESLTRADDIFDDYINAQNLM